MVNKYLTFEDIIDSPFVQVSMVIEGDPNKDGSIPTETRGLGIVTQEVADSLQAETKTAIQVKIARHELPIKRQL